MSISAVSSSIVPPSVSNAVVGQSTKPGSGLGGVTKEIKPHRHHDGGHGPSTQPASPTTASAAKGKVNTLA